MIGLRGRFGVLSEPNVKPLASATLFNAAGNNVYGVALGHLAYDLTGSPLAAGAVLCIRTLRTAPDEMVRKADKSLLLFRVGQ